MVTVPIQKIAENSNHGQDKFLVEMEKIITNKRSVRLIQDAGWYSETEMVEELGWNAFLDCMDD